MKVAVATVAVHGATDLIVHGPLRLCSSYLCAAVVATCPRALLPDVWLAAGLLHLLEDSKKSWLTARQLEAFVILCSHQQCWRCMLTYLLVMHTPLHYVNVAKQVQNKVRGRRWWLIILLTLLSASAGVLAAELRQARLCTAFLLGHVICNKDEQ